jgi:hypothetical protein
MYKDCFKQQAGRVNFIHKNAMQGTVNYCYF